MNEKEREYVCRRVRVAVRRRVSEKEREREREIRKTD